jgi:hypothetical protein
LSDLKVLTMEYDGTMDLYPEVERVLAGVGDIELALRPLELQWPPDPSIGADIFQLPQQHRWQRIADNLDSWTLPRQPVTMIDPTRYDIVALEDGEFAEVFRLDFPNRVYGDEKSGGWLFVLLRDRMIGMQNARIPPSMGTIDTRVEDLNGDGRLDIGFAHVPGKDAGLEKYVSRMEGDERLWLGAWSIAPNGLVPLIPSVSADEHDRARGISFASWPRR